jgi:predicted dehydrogenase
MTIKIILAGLGVRGRHWAEVIRRSARAEIAAYADPNPAALDLAADRFGERPRFTTAEEAIAAMPEANALLLANPPYDRESQIRAAVARNMPLLIEKPLALNVPEAAHLVQLAEQGGVPMMVGLNFRYLDTTLRTMEMLREGLVGAALFTRFTYERYRDGHRPDLNKYPLTMDQPMLWEQSIHHFDLMRYVYGQDPVLIEALTWNPPYSMYKSDANVAALITFSGGLVANYQGLWQSAWAEPNFEWRTDCTKGVIVQKDQFGALHYAQHADKSLTPVTLPPHETWITETSRLLEAFLDAVLNGTPMPCNGRDHLMSLAMVEACAISSRERRAVTIAEVLAQAK